MDQHQINVVVHIPAGKGGVQLVLPTEDLDADTLSALRRLLETRDVESLDAKHVEALSGRRIELIFPDDGDSHLICDYALRCVFFRNDLELINILAQHQGESG